VIRGHQPGLIFGPQAVGASVAVIVEQVTPFLGCEATSRASALNPLVVAGGYPRSSGGLWVCPLANPGPSDHLFPVGRVVRGRPGLIALDTVGGQPVLRSGLPMEHRGQLLDAAPVADFTRDRRVALKPAGVAVAVLVPFAILTPGRHAIRLRPIAMELGRRFRQLARTTPLFCGWLDRFTIS